jgi:DNA-directed RNA polymerase subunit beta
MVLKPFFNRNVGSSDDWSDRLPYLLDIPHESFCQFLEFGLREELHDFPEVADARHQTGVTLSAKKVRVSAPKSTFADCVRNGGTFKVGVFTTACLRPLIPPQTDEELLMFAAARRETEIWLFDLPMMNQKATFIINGVSRVILCQIVRAPGVYFGTKYSNSLGRFSDHATLVPMRGSWLKFRFTKDNEMVLESRNGPISVYLVLLVLGFSREEIVRRIGLGVFRATLEQYPLINTSALAAEQIGMDMNPTPLILTNHEKAVRAGKRYLFSKLFSLSSFDLGEAGRYRLNIQLRCPGKLVLRVPGVNPKTQGQIRRLTPLDIMAVAEKFCRFRRQEIDVDDPKDLAHRCVRGPGQTLQGQIHIGLRRYAKELESRQTMDCYAFEMVGTTHKKVLRRLLYTKSINSLVKQFFVCELSQILDDFNPLAELVQKRRLTGFGPGGLSRDAVPEYMRDIHESQLGRLCILSTSEGKSTGIIEQFSLGARVNSSGFIEVPFYRVVRGRVMCHTLPIYLDALQQKARVIALGSVNLDSDGYILDRFVTVKDGSFFYKESSREIELIEVHSYQMFGVGVGLLPFPEHDDVVRLMMAVGHYRSALPLLRPAAPWVATGMEGQVVRDCGVMLVSEATGVVVHSGGGTIVVKDQTGRLVEHKLSPLGRTSSGTPIRHSTSLVHCHQKVERGQILAEGASSDRGELALGQNVLVAYCPHIGNYEDGMVFSERLVRDHIFTSYHVLEEFCTTRETLFGPEQITRDLLGATESYGFACVRNLDHRGIIKVGSWVRRGDILVGRLAPTDGSESRRARLIRMVKKQPKPPPLRDTSLRYEGLSSVRVTDVTIYPVSSSVPYEKDEVPSPLNEAKVKITLVRVAPVRVGDKFAGRHGNKGVVSQLLPIDEMPVLPDGRIVDVVLNPLGVPSRMNVGQIYECSLGLAAFVQGVRYQTPRFFQKGPVGVMNGSVHLINNAILTGDGLDNEWYTQPGSVGKAVLRDGEMGTSNQGRSTFGIGYLLKLRHRVETKVHARGTDGPYDQITGQPLGGRANKGGQRLGEMEVWALEALGVAFTVQELFTFKSDEILGRSSALVSMMNGTSTVLPPKRLGLPQTFLVVMREMHAMCLDIAPMEVVASANEDLVDEPLQAREVDVFSEFEYRPPTTVLKKKPNSYKGGRGVRP